MARVLCSAWARQAKSSGQTRSAVDADLPCEQLQPMAIEWYVMVSEVSIETLLLKDWVIHDGSRGVLSVHRRDSGAD